MTNYQHQFNQLTGSSSWLQQLKQQAFARFQNIGFPSLRDENWKYTNVRPIMKQEFQQQLSYATHDPIELRKISIQQPDCIELFFIDGIYHHVNAKDESVDIKNLATAIAEDDEYLQKYLNQDAKNIKHGFAALNTAFIQDGALIKIHKNAESTKPIYLNYITTSANISTHPRNLIIVGENSHSVLVENHVALNATRYFTNAISEILIMAGAKLNHIKIQQEQEQAYHIATTQVQQQKDSEYHSHVFSFGAALSRNDINIALAETGARCSLNGLYITRGKQHMDHHTRVDHLKPHGTSQENYKGILDDFSRAVFNGQVYVHPYAHHSDSDQSNKNLLLSEKAEIDTKPQLEIYNDDVKCTHGATVGQLDEQQLFYLQSRGFNQDKAKQILAYAFANELISKVCDQNYLLKFLKKLTLQKLNATFNAEELIL